MKMTLGLLLVAAVVAVNVSEASAQRRQGVMPTRIGQCVNSRIVFVGARLADENDRPLPESGSAVQLANGVYGVSYSIVPAVERSRVGDRVRTCLVSIPRACPPGDERGRVYRTTNLRTRQSWSLPDAQHGCGGA